MHYYNNCDLLEKIQRRSARFVKGDYRTTSSVTQMLHDLGWRDLSDRRRDLRLALLYKVVTGHVAVGPDHTGLVAADGRVHLQPERLVIVTSSLLLLLSRRAQLPSKISLPYVACRNALPPAIGVILCQLLLKTRQGRSYLSCARDGQRGHVRVAGSCH